MVDKFQGQIDDALTLGDNRFSAPTYRVIHFVADVPVRIPPQFMQLAPPGPEPLGPVVYMLCEFQLVDAETEASKRRRRREPQRLQGTPTRRGLSAPPAGITRASGPEKA